MSRLFLGSVKFLGLAATGVALAVGWKLGSYLVDVCLDEETRNRFFEGIGNVCGEEKEPPLWKRQFSRVSDD